MLIKPNDQGMTNKLEALVKHMYSKGREINIIKIQETAATSVSIREFSDLQDAGR